jgi:hypothetical protein
VRLFILIQSIKISVVVNSIAIGIPCNISTRHGKVV